MTGELKAGGIILDLKDGISFPFNYSIADMKDPQKRKRNYSRSVVLPGTKTNMDFFSSTYNMSISTVGGTSEAGFNYDPTVRIPAVYSNQGVVVFNGLLQLNLVTLTAGDYAFECTLFSDFIELFMALGDLKVSELGWSEYNHAYTRENVKNSWATSVMVNGVNTPNMSGGTPLGFGYHYGLVDYGYTRPAAKTFRISDIYPMVYWREIMVKCLQLSGITYTSSFLNSVAFRKRLFGFGGGEKINISTSEVANRRTRLSGSFSSSVSKPGNPLGLYAFQTYVNALSSNNGFIPTVLNDTYQQYEAAPGQVTVERTGQYKCSFSQTLSVNLNNNGMTYYSGGVIVRVQILRNGTVTTQQYVSVPGTGGTVVLNTNNLIDLSLNAGDVIEVRYVVAGQVTYSIPSGSTAQTVTVSLTGTSSSFDLQSMQSTLVDGDTVEISRSIPDMKASDFLAAVILSDNLYVSDPDIDGIVTIEPLAEFYKPTNQFDDWTQLVDHTQKFTIKPSSSIEGKFYKFKFMEDNDYDNKKYRDKFGIGYGDYNYEVESTWQKGERVYQLPFAQTIPTDTLFPMVVPRIISVDEDTQTVKPFKGKPRIYMWNGLKTATWTLANIIGSGSEVLSSYPSVHHFDNWQNPTFDLNWGLPLELSYQTNVITNNNLFTNNHRTFIKEITGRDSKILIGMFKLNSRMINTLDFGKLKMINGVLYRLNQINDFDDNKDESTEVELVKVIAANKRGFRRITITATARSNQPVITSPVGVGSTSPSVPVISGGRNDTLITSQVKRG